MMSPLERPIHIQQVALGYCLPACAQMALAQLGILVNQTQLAQTLRIGIRGGTRIGIGTPFSRAEHLAKWNVRVHWCKKLHWRT